MKTRHRARSGQARRVGREAAVGEQHGQRLSPPPPASPRGQSSGFDGRDSDTSMLVVMSGPRVTRASSGRACAGRSVRPKKDARWRAAAGRESSAYRPMEEGKSPVMEPQVRSRVAWSPRGDRWMVDRRSKTAGTDRWAVKRNESETYVGLLEGFRDREWRKTVARSRRGRAGGVCFSSSAPPTAWMGWGPPSFCSFFFFPFSGPRLAEGGWCCRARVPAARTRRQPNRGGRVRNGATCDRGPSGF